MSPRDALNAGLQGRISVMGAEADMAALNAKCSPQYAPSAARKPWFLSGRPTTSRSIVRIASNRRDGQEIGINEQPPLMEAGVFFYRSPGVSGASCNRYPATLAFREFSYVVEWVMATAFSQSIIQH